MATSLYICYFGVREPLVQTQVIPYLRELARGGHKVRLLTFEAKGADADWLAGVDELRSRLAEQGIEWHWLTYHKRPSVPATVYDVLNGARYILKLSRQTKIDVLHARAHIPLLMAKIAARYTGSKIIFDVRGLVADEYVDGGVWKQDSAVFRLVKKLELSGLRKSDGVVVLTEKLKKYVRDQGLRDERPIEVIPCCVDARFANGAGHVSKRERFELIYAGSVVGLYMLREMGEFFLSIEKHKPEAFFRILTTAPRRTVDEVFGGLGISADDYDVERADPVDVPGLLARANLGISFRKPTFSQIGASPTKIGEYLTAGIPVVMNSGIGDMDEIVLSSGSGVILDNFSSDDLDRASRAALELAADHTIGDRCRETARKYFDLKSVGGERYRRLYSKLLGATQTGDR